jgi:1-phosphofructokinase family hexose kinase
MTHEPGAAATIRRLVCVSVNTSIDKIVAVDHLVPGEIHRPEILSVVPGGKAINVARAATHLGLPSTVIAVVGGHAGHWLVEGLRSRGLSVEVVQAQGETRTCTSILDRSTGQLTDFYEAGLTLDTTGWAAIETAVGAELAQDPAGSVVIVSGSLPPDAPPAAYARIVRLARAAGSRCAVDIGGQPLRLAVAEQPWLVKVNAHEAAEAMSLPVGGLVATVASARALREDGAGIVLVSRGVDGCVLVDEADVAWVIGSPPELGPYSVGSGDSLLAGFLAALASGHSTPDAARRGSAVAAANARRPGQGDIDPADVARIEPRITLERLGSAT